MIKRIAKEVPAAGKNRMEWRMAYMGKLASATNNYLVHLFFDRSNKNDIDKKISVLERLVSGETPKEIGEDFYEILDGYPKENVEW